MANQIKRTVILAAAVAAVAIQASAATYTWVPTTGNQNWNNNTHDADPVNDADNWGTGTGGAFPNAAGDVANVNNNITAQVNISLIAPSITVGTLNLGDVDGLSLFTVAGPSLTFDSATAGVPAQINVRNIGVVSNSISAPITLNSDLRINLDPSTTVGNKQALGISGAVTTTGRTITINGGYKGATDGTQMTFSGADTLIGNGTIINNSDSPMVISGQKPAFTGTLVANGQGVGQDGNTGTVTLSTGFVPNAAEIIVNGYHDGTTQWGGKLQIGTGSPQAAPTMQRLTQNRITMNGGLFSDSGVSLVAGNTGVLQTDTVATVDFNSGFSLMNVAATKTSAGNVLNVTSVERGSGATAFYRAVGLQTSDVTPFQTYVSQMKAGNAASLVVGSTATSGTATRIIPWMVTSANVSNLGFASFATYDAATGFRPLIAGEFSNTMATGANIVTGNYTSLTQDWTVNSVFHNSNGIQRPNAAGGPHRTISIASGGLIFSSSGGALGEPGNVDGRGGTISFGSVEGIVMNAANATNGIGSAITGSGGFTKGGFGRLILTGSNTITGDTNVSGGVLQVGDGTYDSSIGDGDVFVHAGAVLDLRKAAATTGTGINLISDTASLDLFAYGLYTGQANIFAGIETVASLTLGDAVMPAGYYGSTTAATAYLGTYTVVANDTYFAGNGLVQVVAVPEPATASLLGLGLGGLFMGRRRSQG